MTPADTNIWAARLFEDGYCIIPDLADATCRQLAGDVASVLAEAPFCTGDFYGYRTKRIGGLPRRSVHARDLILHPLVLALAHRVLGPACERIQLNVAQLIEIHPGEIEQFPHRDDDMWPVAKNGTEYLLNVIWPLDSFTAENGATRIYPGTHREGISDLADLPEPQVAACAPGSAICFLGSTIHGAGANRSHAVRRGVVVGYSLGWLKPHENPWLAYPPAVARDFPEELAALAGYVQHRPNLGNHEGKCPSLLLRDQQGAAPGPADALRPDQAEMVAAFAGARRGGQ
ncbi:phytanoyl-CoA dioxygenase family protein [Qipengyuania qiaonensis]|uniref:Phytanoyl-CoA dioxygenase family protein n=1 Tax=Qipengyuania qiaonensis TaxID=2867240 RepID=A0ABS7J336_9SPHN|nr:phytanoyl-CoA dioxygenase family protein [Qipengyuania qiaonensis]MBX7481686.1 phytanoyl-CoA dioxygenase family protein [Qipengyuania qiaonensis]